MSRYSNDAWWPPDEDDWLPLDDGPDDGELAAGDDEPDDPFGLFSADLQEYLDEEASAVDRAVFGEQDEDEEDDLDEDPLDEWEYGVPQQVRSLFDPPLEPPREEDLDDEALRRHYDAILAQLAEFNIRLDTCEHFNLRDCYRYLVDVVLNEEAYPYLGGSDIDQYFTTQDDCPFCEESDE